ncbi:MAG: metallophosphoesterase [Planctomycetota bacterium]
MATESPTSWTRRGLMRAGGAAAVGGLVAGPARAQAVPDTDAGPWVALLSDPHIDADPGRTVRGVRMAETFEAVVGRLVAAGSSPPACVMVNGDVARDVGNNGDYAVLNRLMVGFGPSRSRVYFTAGNHDHRGNMLDAGLFAGEPVVEEKLCQKLAVGGADWYLLDSLRFVDEVAGSLGDAQLAWLAEKLDAGPADRPAFVLTHHQPEDPKDPDDDGFGLADGRALVDLIWSRRRVKAVFHGHRHAFGLREANGVHLVGQPSTAYVFRDTATPGYLEARVRPDHVELTRRAVTPDGPHEGETFRLAFR